MSYDLPKEIDEIFNLSVVAGCKVSMLTVYGAYLPKEDWYAIRQDLHDNLAAIKSKASASLDNFSSL